MAYLAQGGGMTYKRETNEPRDCCAVGAWDGAPSGAPCHATFRVRRRSSSNLPGGYPYVVPRASAQDVCLKLLGYLPCNKEHQDRGNRRLSSHKGIRGERGRTHSAVKVNCFPSLRNLATSFFDFSAAFFAASSSRLILASC